MRYLLLALAPFLLLFCKNEVPPHRLVVSVAQAALRAAPGERSVPLQSLKAGETVTDLGETSRFESIIRFQDEARQAPWLRVRTTSNQDGWLFAGAVEPLDHQADWLLQKRLACYFGPTLTMRRNTLVKHPGQATDEVTLALLYRSSVSLRDTFTQLLARRAETGAADVQIDFTWLSNALPGFIYQQVAEGTQAWLFAHYRFWADAAKETTGQQDDLFFTACLTAFPIDSIESFFPNWKFQISSTEAASRLGDGVHWKMLLAIEQAWAAGPLFHPELAALKNQVLEDILGKNTVFWQPKEKIVRELGQIVERRFTSLSQQERAELQLRLRMFDDPKANGIRVNARAGTE